MSLLHRLQECPDDASAVGGKAGGLTRLARAGLPVPPGFVLTADAFRAYLDAHGIDVSDGAAAAERLRTSSWPAELRTEIERAYEDLRQETGGQPVAVRSSATAEDSAGASFAGQHATLLNIQGTEALLDAVIACWASLFSEHAAMYRRTQQVQDERPAMAVVVQALVPSDASGVAFTLDPVSGDRDLVMIEAAWGLGEAVVAGIVSPDNYAVRKSDGAMVRKHIAEKHLRIVSDAEGGTRQESLPPDLAKQPVLSDDQAAEIARIAASIEELHGAPQDIEWALAEGRFYLLQARPITAMGGGAPPVAGGAAVAPATPGPAPAPAPEEWISEFDSHTDPNTIWTSANVQEVLPDQLSPFGCSVTAKLIEDFGTEPIERMGVKLENPDPFSAYFYGRAFLNVSMMIEVSDQMPFGSVEAVMEQFFGQGRDQFEAAPPKRRTLSRILRYILITPRMLWFTLRMPRDIKRAERIVQDFEREMAERPFGDMTDEELIAAIDDGVGRGGEVAIIHVSGGGVTSSQFEWLRRLTERWLDDKNGMVQATLCTGLAGLESAQPAYELWDISRIVLASPALREAFASRDGAEIERRVAALPPDDTLAFHERLQQFLARHGHRSVMEAEAAAKSWSEDLPTVFAMVRNYIDADDSVEPRRVEERQRREREEATRRARKQLSWWRRVVFGRVLGEAQRWVVMREHTKSLMVRASDRGRKASRELARRMVERGLLGDIWDFYYLSWDEARSLLRGALSAKHASEHIERRKAEEERNRRVLLPETFQGRPKPLRPEDAPLPEGHSLRGIAVSPGRVTGKARVIMDPRRDAAIEPGEILVAPVTDAGWTPLFIAATGVVVDVGGTLSHGSTVAREYGLPAVVNVKHGTRMIRTGQTITVDGSEGVVILNGGELSP
jgi:pyruvate,water dikinase